MSEMWPLFTKLSIKFIPVSHKTVLGVIQFMFEVIKVVVLMKGVKK